MPKVSGFHDDPIRIDKTGQTYEFTKSYVGDTPGYRPITEEGKNNTILMHGKITTVNGYEAIDSLGPKVDIHVFAGSVIGGAGSAIGCDGRKANVVNDGSLIADTGYSAIDFSDGSFDGRIVNNARISGTGSGIDFAADGTVATNSKGASVITGQDAVRMTGDEGATLKFVNNGTLKTSDFYAVTGNSSNDILINHGRISGNIRLSDGDDIIDLRGGTLTGTIVGDDGDDVLITDDASYSLKESNGAGVDTVKSTVSYAQTGYVEKLVLLGNKNINGRASEDTAGTLIGNAGNNKLTSSIQSDRLDGRGGNDVLKGGTGVDDFVFGTGYGRDRIVDFEAGVEVVDIAGWKAIKTFNAVKSHAENHGQDVWIVAGKDVLVIENMHKNDLHSGDFDF